MDVANTLQQKAETGYVESGWSAATWADRLRYLAGRCEQQHPDLAADYRRWADNIRIPAEPNEAWPRNMRLSVETVDPPLQIPRPSPVPGGIVRY